MLTTEAVRDQIGILMIKAKKRPEDLAKLCGISRTSMYERLVDPAAFRFGEMLALEALAERYHMSILEVDG